MNHFFHKHRYLMVAIVALALISMVVYVMSDDESLQPGPANQNNAPMPAADGP